LRKSSSAASHFQDLDEIPVERSACEFSGAWIIRTSAGSSSHAAPSRREVSRSLAENRRLSPAARPVFGEALAARTQSLITENGLTSVDGVPVTGPRFNENLPLRDQPPVATAVAGARATRQVIDRVAWVEQTASSVAIAPFLRHSPPAGSAARPFILQFARSDVVSTTSSSMDILRAGRFADRAHHYRHDLNVGDPGVVNYPHMYLYTVQSPPNFARVALGAASDRDLLCH
jgi:hypothetical protein